jgi:hypothetical protein
MVLSGSFMIIPFIFYGAKTRGSCKVISFSACKHRVIITSSASVRGACIKLFTFVANRVNSAPLHSDVFGFARFSDWLKNLLTEA